jgi:hypothetical protein
LEIRAIEVGQASVVDRSKRNHPGRRLKPGCLSCLRVRAKLVFPASRNLRRSSFGSTAPTSLLHHFAADSIPSSILSTLHHVSLRRNNALRHRLRPRNPGTRSRIRIRTVRPVRRWSTTSSIPPRNQPHLHHVSSDSILRLLNPSVVLGPATPSI